MIYSEFTFAIMLDYALCLFDYRNEREKEKESVCERERESQREIYY